MRFRRISSLYFHLLRDFISLVHLIHTNQFVGENMQAQNSFIFNQSSKSKTLSLVQAIKDADEDHAWYPTTDEILSTIREDMDEEFFDSPSVLDCGAGDGRALMALTKGNRYAIEKSKPLIEAMDKSIYIVGTEFREQTLIDKAVDAIFVNPPYFEYETWMEKVIKEANASYIYFVVPKRWIDNKSISDALKLRSAEAEVIGEFDFLGADRAARVDVDIVRVTLCYSSRHNTSPKVDPFDLWFDEHFSLSINKSESSKYDLDKKRKIDVHEGVQNSLVTGTDLITSLEKLYQRDLAKLMKNYMAIQELDYFILFELNVNIDSVKAGLKQKIEGLKDTYWSELFDNLTKITDRLTHKSRTQMLDRLTNHTHVDFTVSNAYAVLIWVIKNANSYFDDQVVSLVEKMTEVANVQLYQSNKKTFKDEDWKYCNRPSGLDRYSLDYRIVLHNIGGINCSSWEHERARHCGLSESAYNFINDILAVAGNIGFDTAKTAKAGDFQWVSNKGIDFYYYNHTDKKEIQLMQVRAFKNGNLHIKFNEALISKLNVEFGRLKGWIKSPKDAVDEMGVSMEVAEASFNSNLRLDATKFMQIGFDAPA